MIRIMIVDDHPMALEGMKEILKEEPTFKIVGEAMTGKEAVEKTAIFMPDLILMDINLPDVNGMEATRLIKSTYPYVKIVMVTVSDDIVDLFESIKNGAQGYLLKHVEHDSWIPYLQAIMNDDVQIDKPLAKQMLKEFSSHQLITEDKRDSLSTREREILTWVAKGLTNKEISLRLEISEYTVKNHLKNLFQKLHLNNRVQLAKYAYEHGYLKDS
ncbi:response regulator [Pseudogracilibacillus auburnensis]|uniref:LuxR family two component transcriptional regulator n=1 Tax=Pseudogracilibacillus auburnensis TaxID=1494959 RepID=A0A2V3W0Z1_9BACI|nr:response regulator transcription factor [Pseudogracilibacillus auburnensis]MBO1002250.1 response regulator transcription factor [Pseudogracilibacillus auburnensis]PXW87580.1 LuxR family two component transcriptional regulator [Pseudogracilibacillus auburnensis]